jgi:hypothetical protein
MPNRRQHEIQLAAGAERCARRVDLTEARKLAAETYESLNLGNYGLCLRFF